MLNIFKIVIEGDIDVVRELIRNDASNVDEQDNEGNTPLNIACREGHDDIVLLLLSIFANTLTENNRGLTPVETSVLFGFPHLVSILQHYVTAGDKFELPDVDLDKKEVG